MSEGMDLSTDTVYVELLHEGTKVLRPTMGVPLGNMVYKLEKTKDYDPDDEEWNYPPGSVVRCILEDHESEQILVAKERVNTEQENACANDEPKIKYLFVNLRYSQYMKIQAVAFALCILGAVFFYLYLAESKSTPLRYLWVVALLGALVEVIEAILAIRRAKKKGGQR